MFRRWSPSRRTLCCRLPLPLALLFPASRFYRNRNNRGKGSKGSIGGRGKPAPWKSLCGNWLNRPLAARRLAGKAPRDEGAARRAFLSRLKAATYKAAQRAEGEPDGAANFRSGAKVRSGPFVMAPRTTKHRPFKIESVGHPERQRP